ncbi:MAG: sel1 repeat family protein [Hyphomicrobium sp.]
MRIFKQVTAGLVFSLAASAAALAASGLTFKSADDAMRQGIAAFNGGYYEIAVPALEAVAETNPAVGRFYLARIYADNDGSYTDHGKAYAIFKALADELQDIDPDDDTLAPIAAKSLTAISSYLRDGIPDSSVRSNVREADRALQRAALTFNNEDAQFELAKVLLRGEGPDITLGGPDDPSSKIENGRHWLGRLSRSGHAGAQAFLADLMWRGKFVPKDQAAALNLIDVAVAHAPLHERVWIEDIYQNIFCNAGEGVRQQATGRVADWHDRYGGSRRKDNVAGKSGLDDLAAEPVRTCANGEAVLPMAKVMERAQPERALPAPGLAPDMGREISTPPAYVPSDSGAPPSMSLTPR